MLYGVSRSSRASGSNCLTSLLFTDVSGFRAAGASGTALGAGPLSSRSSALARILKASVSATAGSPAACGTTGKGVAGRFRSGASCLACRAPVSSLKRPCRATSCPSVPKGVRAGRGLTGVKGRVRCSAG